MADHVHGVHLVRTDENAAEIDALADLLGGRVDLAGLLTDLNRRGRRAWAPGRATRWAMTWDAADRRTRRWWPQGVTTSADASPGGRVHGRRLLAATWYAKDDRGARITFVDLDTRRYRHVLLVVPSVAPDGSLRLAPLTVHAGGAVWVGDHLHVAATARGLVTCRVSDLLRVPDRLAGDPGRLQLSAGSLSSYGYRYLLPVRFSYEAATDEGHQRLRYSFVSLDRQPDPPQLLAGEYALGDDRTRRLVRYDLDPDTGLLVTGSDGVSRPLQMEEGVHQTQGAVAAAGRYHLTVSHGPWLPGSVYVGHPGRFVRRRWATPMGPEDVAYWPGRDELWSLSEHPHRRWVFAMPRRALGG